MRRATLVSGLMLLGAALPAAAQNRLFNHETNQWEVLEPGATALDAIEQPQRGEGPASRRYKTPYRLNAWTQTQDADPASVAAPANAPPRADVAIRTGERPGTLIIDTERRTLLLVEGEGRATRYPVGVGREGFGFSGTVEVGRKAEWPDWTPPLEMREREAARGRDLPERLSGGEDNPSGARALYLFRHGRDTLYRIHGTNEPWTVGTRTSSGCIRMRNEDVVDLYNRVPQGARVVVIGPDGAGRADVYRDGPA